jgi:hypothetical protein
VATWLVYVHLECTLVLFISCGIYFGGLPGNGAPFRGPGYCISVVCDILGCSFLFLLGCSVVVVVCVSGLHLLGLYSMGTLSSLVVN